MRIEKVNEVIRVELAQILLSEGVFGPGVMVTVQRIATSDTLEHATVWISVLPEGKEGTVLTLLRENIADIQKKLNRRLEMRFVPKIVFKIDESVKAVKVVEEILGSLE
ncbi:MAG: ribosome-binding factor A [Patescibacteria group bacterium]